MGIGSIGTGELLIILAIVLLLFGAKKLPELARGLGRGISEFKKAAGEVSEELKTDKIEQSASKDDESNEDKSKDSNAESE